MTKPALAFAALGVVIVGLLFFPLVSSSVSEAKNDDNATPQDIRVLNFYTLGYLITVLIVAGALVVAAVKL